jgi:hypothetical protein
MESTRLFYLLEIYSGHPGSFLRWVSVHFSVYFHRNFTSSSSPLFRLRIPLYVKRMRDWIDDRKQMHICTFCGLA